jgi:hypothetical protein
MLPAPFYENTVLRGSGAGWSQIGVPEVLCPSASMRVDGVVAPLVPAREFTVAAEKVEATEEAGRRESFEFHGAPARTPRFPPSSRPTLTQSNSTNCATDIPDARIKARNVPGANSRC